MDIEAVYSRLPGFAQNLACTYEGFRIQKRRYNTEFRRLLSEAERRSAWTTDQVMDYRDQHLRAYVQDCAREIPYFREQFENTGIAPESIRSVEDLRALPILSKSEAVANSSRLQSRTVNQQDCIVCHTSGTTGSGLRFSVTLEAFRAQWAVWWRYRRWHGIDLATKCAYFGGRSVVPITQKEAPFWRYDLARHQILFSGYHISEATLPLYVEELRRQRPSWLCGYPSLLTLLASYVLERGDDLGYTPRWITALAENLLPLQKSVITKAFGVSPIEHYGMAEGAANISECEMGRLHVDEDFSAVEFVPEDGIDSCRIIGTAFVNRATAFLRYEVGDRVRVSLESSCPCGRPGRLVEAIDGRLEDYVIRRDGSKVGRMDHIFKDLVNIREAQIVQEAPGQIEIRIVRGALYAEDDEKRLRSEMWKRLGTETEIKIEYRESLPRGAGGKLRFVISSLHGGRIATEHKV
jgi:phenylacetate-coenzyme A ligase PaaK-like adenylate-forming protein